LPLPFSFDKKMQLRQISDETLRIVSAVIGYLKQHDIVVGELYDYSNWFKAVKLSPEARAGVKQRGETAQLFAYIDAGVAKIVRDRIRERSYTVPPSQLKEEVILKRVQRKLEKVIEKEERTKSEQEQQAKRLLQQEKEIKEAKRARLRERRKEKEEETEQESGVQQPKSFQLSVAKLLEMALKPSIQTDSALYQKLFLQVKNSTRLNDTLAALEFGDWARYLRKEDQLDDFMINVVILVKNYQSGGQLNKTGAVRVAGLQARALVKTQENLESMLVTL